MPDHFYVYPEYLSKAGSRAEGRRVASSLAPPEVTIEGIAVAARALGFQAVVEPDKQYPRRYYRYAGRVKVTKQPGITKTRFLRDVAEELRRHPPAEAPR